MQSWSGAIKYTQATGNWGTSGALYGLGKGLPGLSVSRI